MGSSRDLTEPPATNGRRNDCARSRGGKMSPSFQALRKKLTSITFDVSSVAIDLRQMNLT